jgi:cilla- and flagella-associated protein
LTNLEVVSLSVNKISTLQDFGGCPRIQELYLRKNNVVDLNEIYHLQPLKYLKVLWLSDNPCASDQLYRLFIIKALPQLKKIDSTEISDEERQKAFQANFDHMVGISKQSNNRNILQQNLMSQNNARKSPFKSNENLNVSANNNSKNNISSSKLESLRSQENQSGYTP